MRNRIFSLVLVFSSLGLLVTMVAPAPASWGDRSRRADAQAEEFSIVHHPEEIGYVLQPGDQYAPAPVPSELLLPSITCNDRCIDYIYRRWRKCRWECEPTMQMLLQVIDPCSGDCCTPPCLVDIPVCMPCCCMGEPVVDCRKGPLGRGVVTYEWCCGYKIKIVFHRCGDITVVSNAL